MKGRQRSFEHLNVRKTDKIELKGGDGKSLVFFHRDEVVDEWGSTSLWLRGFRVDRSAFAV